MANLAKSSKWTLNRIWGCKFSQPKLYRTSNLICFNENGWKVYASHYIICSINVGRLWNATFDPMPKVKTSHQFFGQNYFNSRFSKTNSGFGSTTLWLIRLWQLWYIHLGIGHCSSTRALPVNSDKLPSLCTQIVLFWLPAGRQITGSKLIFCNVSYYRIYCHLLCVRVLRYPSKYRLTSDQHSMTLEAVPFEIDCQTWQKISKNP